MTDLLDLARERTGGDSYTAHDIEVLEGLEPVRRRPGMYVGGTDERALHHLVAEVLDNAMDEAVAGHATRIELELAAGNRLTVRDNGRGIPIDPHPKFPDKSALEVIMTTLHSGGKFGGKAYETSGGLHGVGVSVVNALSSELVVEVARNRSLYAQRYARGLPLGPLEMIGAAPNRRGTTISFVPDTEIFGPTIRFRPELVHRMARSKAYLFRGVEIRWRCDPTLLEPGSTVPAEDSFHFPQGLADFLKALLDGRDLVVDDPFTGEAALEQGCARRMGDRLADRRGDLHRLVLQHRPDAARRHARGRPAQRAAQGPAHPRRTDRLQARQHGHRRRRDGRRLPAAVAVRAPAAVPGPDQGAAGLARGDTAGRERDQGPVRALAGQPSGHGDGRARAYGAPCRGADRAPQGQGRGRP